MKVKYTFLIVIAVVFTGFAVFNSMTTYKNAQRSSENLLNSTAYFIGITLGQALHRTGIDEDLFRDIILSQPWDEIAHISLYDESGKILLHSERELIGQKEEDSTIGSSIKKTAPTSYFMTLKSGEEAYLMDMPMHIHDTGSQTVLLRIALYTWPAADSLKHAKIHAVTAMIIVVFIWILSFATVRYSRKVIGLHMKELEKRHFTMLGEMAAVLAHEIRSPLSAIKGFAQYMNEKKEDGSSSKEGLDVIITESQRLERLTEDLLVYARTSDVKKERFALTPLVEEVEALFSEGREHIHFDKDRRLVDDFLESDREKLKQVLINIIQNALDAIGNKGRIHCVLSESDGSISIAVRDSGTGIDEDVLKKVISPFFTTKTKGTGLGLAIVDNLIKTLQGTLQIESEPGRGTEVTITVRRSLR